MRVLSAVSVMVVLAACGVDGEPEQPDAKDGQPAVRVTGDARIGMAVGDSGTRGFGAVSLNNGPVTMSIGF